MPYLILDRDGVINEDSDAYIKSPEEWNAVPGSLKAIARANRAGYRVIVVTNQSGLARGLFDIDTLNAIHLKMHKKLAKVGGKIDAVLFCPHGPDDDCRCRKPLPGMLEQIRDRLNISLERVPVIGDSYRDLEAARAVGAKPVLVRTGKGERTLTKEENDLSDVDIYDDLDAFVSDLLN